MELDWVFNDCNETSKTRLRGYWHNKQPRVRNLLTHFSPDLINLRLTVYCEAERHRIRAVLELPTGTLVAEQYNEDPLAALDLVTDVIVRDLKRHRAHLRRDYMFRRRMRQREALDVAGPLLERDVEKGYRSSFFELLGPLLDSVHAHASRELRMLELQGSIVEGAFTPADMVDDVLTSAWESFSRKPDKPLELWLLALLHERLDRVASEPSPESLAERAREEEWAEEPDWRDQILGYEQVPTLDELMSDPRESLADNLVESEEQRMRVIEVLATVPAEQRRALTLLAFEGFGEREIASIQDRPEHAVRRDIVELRRMLQSRAFAQEPAVAPFFH